MRPSRLNKNQPRALPPPEIFEALTVVTATVAWSELFPASKSTGSVALAVADSKWLPANSPITLMLICRLSIAASEARLQAGAGPASTQTARSDCNSLMVMPDPEVVKPTATLFAARLARLSTTRTP